jgi:hypothetical protein
MERPPMYDLIILLSIAILAGVSIHAAIKGDLWQWFLNWQLAGLLIWAW